MNARANDAVIRVERLTKVYGSVIAVEDVSFEVKRGEIFGLVGPNGAGKTTTVECMTGMRFPSSGEVEVLGLDPRSQGSELKRRIGIQMQKAALPDRIKVWEALDLYSSFYKAPLDWRVLMETWGLSTKRNAAFINLSGGQKQRLFVALALLNDPEIVFLDELTSGLDPQARRASWELMRGVREAGKTVVLTTHYMDEAEHLCDRVAIIDRGRILALDSPDALIRGLGVGIGVSFAAENGFDPGFLRTLADVVGVERAGDRVVVRGGGYLLAQVATALVERGISPQSLETERPTLEDVFLALTGREVETERRRRDASMFQTGRH
ncbi:MAG: ABC transporter ATP-binding protein [Chloroflexia bacterium]